MSEITLKINNRGYSLSCDQGQEQRLADLGAYVDSRLKDIAASGAATNESHLLVLTALVLADELFDLRKDVTEMNEKISYLRSNTPEAASYFEEEEAMVAQAIEHLADRIEHMAMRLEQTEDAQAA